MKIRMLKNIAGPGFPAAHEGEVIDIDENVAEKLIAAQAAEPAPEAKKATTIELSQDMIEKAAQPEARAKLEENSEETGKEE